MSAHLPQGDALTLFAELTERDDRMAREAVLAGVRAVLGMSGTGQCKASRDYAGATALGDRRFRHQCLL